MSEPEGPAVRAEDLGFLGRLGLGCARHGVAVIATWVVVAIAFGVGSVFFGGELVNDFTIPGAGSQKAQDLLDETFPQVAGNAATLVFKAESGTLTSPQAQAAVDDALERAATVEGVLAVGNPYQQQNGALNRDGTVAFANVQFQEQSFDVPQEQISQLEDGSRAAVADSPVEVNFTGAVITNNVQVDDARSEGIGLIVALIILILMLGTLVSASLPIVIALTAVGVGLALVTFEADLVNLNTVTPTLATMLGLGVGIDYSLFILTRHRQGLEAGLPPKQAAGVAVATAGRAVTFAWATVLISVAALAVFGLSFITVLGLGAAATVLTAMLAANTLLPAILGLLGHRVNALRIPFLHRKASPGPNRSVVGRWCGFVTRHAAFVAPLAVIVLLVLALPVLKADLGAADAGTFPEGQTERIAYDQIADAFGPGFNGPLLIAINQSEDPTLGDQMAEAVQGVEGVAAVNPPVVNPQGTTAVVTVVPTTSPQSEETSELVNSLRDDVIPEVLAGKDASAFVGGVTAAFDDIAERIFPSKLIYFVLLVVGVILVVLTTAFRSLAVGVKAAICMLLSAAASFGVLIAVFQLGWAIEIVGLDTTGPIESYLPPVVFAILFGLSTDYEVFLVSRIREEYAHGAPAREAIRKGVGAIGNVVVAGALIMTAVFFSFILTDSRVVKEFGLALGVSILIDAFIVRLTLVPAVMHLMGERMWWIPAWLDRILPPLTIEPAIDDAAASERRPATQEAK